MEDDSNTGQVKVRLELHASQLKNVAGAFKGTSDPYCVVTLLSSDPSKKPRVLGKTETIKNNLNPRWTTSFDVDYEIGVLSRINIGIYDEVRKSENKPMGSAMFEIGEVMGSRGNTKGKKLRNGGTIFLRVTPAPTEDLGTLSIRLCGVDMTNADGLFFHKLSPFFELFAKVDVPGGLTWHPVYRSKHIRNDANPKWQPFKIDLGRLCSGDLDKPILVKVWDWEKSGRHNSLGAFETTVNELVAAASSSKQFVTQNGGKEYGKVQVTMAEIEGGSPKSLPLDQPSTLLPATATEPVPYVPPPLPMAIPPPTEAMPMPIPARPPTPRFVDYLSGGCELEMCVAIDFTGSNGDPRRPGTLHYIHQDGQLNDYEKALTAVGSIIARYDSDQKFPAWGFGAKYGGVIQHCFQIGSEEELSGIHAVLEGYRSVFRTGLTMSGPTVLAEVIGLAAAKARSRQDSAERVGGQAYKILLILTDGAVSDVNLTRTAIGAADDAPLSIVIVGIGNADFSAMRFLDEFQELDSTRTGRDICKFVEFNKYRYDKASLTRETLSEIPCQLVDYFNGRGIQPLRPVAGSQITFHVDEADEQDIDLSIDMNAEGEISLANETGAVYDDTKYDTMSQYSHQQTTTAAPFVPYSSAPEAPIAPPKPIPPQFSSYQQPPAPRCLTPPKQHQQQPAVHHPRSPYGGPMGMSESRLFHVRVPPGVSPGRQLKVRNPTTNQELYVVVPHGVAPGGTFAVRY